MHSQEYLNTKQAAERYGLSVSWLTKLRMLGRGSPHLKVGRRVLYERAHFERWLTSHRRLTTQDQHAASDLEAFEASRAAIAPVAA